MAKKIKSKLSRIYKYEVIIIELKQVLQNLR